MKVVELSETGLRIVDHHLGIVLVLLPMALLMLIAAGVQLGAGGWRNSLAALLGAGVCAAAGGAFATRRCFDFDLINRRLDWRKVGFNGSASGTIPFEQIHCAFVEYSEGNNAKSPRDFYRVVLATDLVLLPLSGAFAGGPPGDEHCQQVRTLINKSLGRVIASESDNDIIEMVRAGQKLWACRLAQRRKGFGAFGTSQAMAYVDSLAGKHLRSERPGP